VQRTELNAATHPELRLLSIAEFANLTSTAPSSVRQWAKDGRLRTVKVGDRRLVPASELKRVVTKGL
jgi:excisionase family DNA binding protein